MPICSEMVEGSIGTNPETETWYIPHRYYRLTSVKMYKNSANTSGFEVTYSPPDEFDGWETQSHLFGYTD